MSHLALTGVDRNVIEAKVRAAGRADFVGWSIVGPRFLVEPGVATHRADVAVLHHGPHGESPGWLIQYSQLVSYGCMDGSGL